MKPFCFYRASETGVALGSKSQGLAAASVGFAEGWVALARGALAAPFVLATWVANCKSSKLAGG